MTDKSKKQSDEPSLPSFEMDLFGALFGFHEKAMTLLRQSHLADEKLDLVAKQLQRLLDETTIELKRTKMFADVAGRLESVYEELKRLIDELSGSQNPGPNNPEMRP